MDMTALLRAFWSYETALAANDLDALDHWFADAPDTLRAEGTTVLTGHAAIADFRRRRPGGGAPARTIERLHAVPLDDSTAVLTAETRRPDGTRGLQTQVWQHAPGDGWRIRAAHVSAVPPTPPAITDDPAVWRATGTPLVAPPTRDGPLRHTRLAVKDLFAVAGHPIGAGNPRYLAESTPQPRHAAAVQTLLDAGAEVTGIAHTDEFAFSLAGTNAHYGAPDNPAAPGRITGGSSSGPAAAVARGEADLGLATDTAGSIRVPASYCGLYGWRPTHGALPSAGLLPLAPSFDTPGLLARDPALLRTAAACFLSPPPESIHTLTTTPTLTALATPETRASFTAAARALSLRTGLPLTTLALPLDPAWFTAFRTVQAGEAWQQHGPWIEDHTGALSPDVAARFAAGRDVTPSQRAAARATLSDARATLTAVIPPGTALLLPATSGPAPFAEEAETARAATLRLTHLASLAGLPAAVAPLLRVRDLPVGLCAIAAPGTDLALLELL
jgi:amidase